MNPGFIVENLKLFLNKKLTFPPDEFFIESEAVEY